MIQEFGGVKPAYIKTIRRQQNETYKNAVKAISNDNLEKGYQILDSFGAIKESQSFAEMTTNAAKEYADALQKKENTLVVATTHAQGKATTQSIRVELKERNLLAEEEKSFTTQTNLSYTEAQKKDAANYGKGMSIQFHQNAKGIKRGSVFDVLGRDKEGKILIADKDKNQTTLSLEQSKKFSVYRKEELPLAKGDRIRITQNGFSTGKKRLNNGNILQVKGFDKSGNIIASNGKKEVTLGKDYRNFTHGYYTTSPASQGKSVNRVIIMQSTSTGKAASKEQFYVSASRGKFAISVYTDDKDHLLKSIKNSSQRMTAGEVAKNSQSKANPLLDKMKKMAAIYRAGLSKMSDSWHNSRDSRTIVSLTTKPVKPVSRGPIRTK